MPSSSSSSESSDSSSDSEQEGKVNKPADPEGAPPAKKAKTDGGVVVSSDSGSDSESDADSSGDSAKDDGKKKKDKKDKDDSDSASDASEESAKKKKNKKDKKKKKAKKKKKGKKDKKAVKSKKSKKKDKGKKDKKDKKGKKSKKGKVEKKKKKIKNKGATRDAVSNQYGKFGILKQEDFFNLKPEFMMWGAEVKKTNLDELGQMKQKDLFKEFVEDYNTATMPSKKYYDLRAWDAAQAVKRSKRIRTDDMSDAQKASLASFDDEKSRKEEIKQQQYKKQEQSLKSEVDAIRANKEKVEEMGHQMRLRTQLEMLMKQGRTKEADALKARMNPGNQGPRDYAPRTSGEGTQNERR